VPSLYTKVALGADWSGEGLNLVALGRRFRRTLVIGTLHLGEAESQEARRQVADFLRRQRIREAAVTACLPRAAVLVRFLSLPLEAEARLTQVVGYQIGGLHPYPHADVFWDCAVVEREPKTRQIRVLVAVAERSSVDRYYRVLCSLGLRVKSLTVRAAAITPLASSGLPETALVVCGREDGVELMGFLRRRISAAREVPSEPREDLSERFERELHGLRASLRVPDLGTVPIFVCGSLPRAFAELIPQATPMRAPGLKLSLPRGFDLAVEFPAFAAAYAGLERPRYAGSINLLPASERRQPARALRAPLYALGCSAALLAVATLGHGWIESQIYARALDRQARSLAAAAAVVRNQEQQASALAARARVLEGVREGTWGKLRILRELTQLLPDSTWVQELQLSDSTVELYGYSSHAADLVRPLENSPYFTQVEFTTPITRDSQNREVFRMRIQLKQAVRR
jgi:Tfp pilus assembly protein PilN